MSGASQCLCAGARRALHGVFISPAALGPPIIGLDHSRPRLFTRPARPPPSGARRGAGGHDGGGLARDPFDERERRGFDKRYTTLDDIEKSGRDRPPQDDEITDPYVMVTDGSAPRGPLATRSVVRGLTPEQSLRMIQPYVPADPDANVLRAQLALCRIVNKRDEYERQRELKRQRRADAAAGKGKSKELDFSWSIGEHDLAIKMRQLAQFLQKGIRVEVTIDRRKGGKEITAEEAAALVKKVRDAVEEHGGREKVAATGEMLRNLKLTFGKRGS